MKTLPSSVLFACSQNSVRSPMAEALAKRLYGQSAYVDSVGVRAEEVEAQAASLIEKQRWQAAVDALRNGEPLGPRGTNMLGRALLQLGDKEGARLAFERTLASEPDNRIALRQLEALGT